MRPEDDELLRRAATGDDEAFAVFYRRHRGPRPVERAPLNAWNSLEDELRAATRRAAAGRFVWFASRRGRAPWLALAAGLAAAALVFLVVVRGDGSGTIPADERAVATATAAAGAALLPSGSSVSHSPVPADQLALFAVLRRPQTPDERSDVLPLLKRVKGQRYEGVRASAIRVLARTRGEIVALVPMERGRFGRDPNKDVLDPLCLLRGSEQRGYGVTCGTLDDVLGGRVGWTRPPAGLAPDIAARVGLRVGGGRTITVTPRNNFYDAAAIDPSLVGIQPPRWINAQGDTVRLSPVPVPSPPGGSRPMPKLDPEDLRATPVAPGDPSLNDALSLLDERHEVVRAWRVRGLRGHVLLTRKGGQWCLSTPDPLTDQPDVERGVGCVPDSRFQRHGAYIGLVPGDGKNRITVTVKPDLKTIRVRQQ
jgi:hypothetical protein